MEKKEEVDFDFEFSASSQWKAFAKKEAEASTARVQRQPVPLSPTTDTTRATSASAAVSAPPGLVPPLTPSSSTSPPATSAQYSSQQTTYQSYYATQQQSNPQASRSPNYQNNQSQTALTAAFSRGQREIPDINSINRNREDVLALEGILEYNDAQKRGIAKQGPPDDTYNFAVFFPDGFKTKFSGIRDAHLAAIAEKTGTYLTSSDQDIHVVEMYGTKEAIEEAKQDLSQLGRYARANANLKFKTAKGKFAKTKAAPTEIQAERLAKHWTIDEKRLHYKRPPEDPSIFPAMGVFLWPEESVNVQTALGINTEALDQLRLDHECHIEYVRKTQSLHVYGTKPQEVSICVNRIYGILCEVATKRRCLGSTATKFHMVTPPTADQFLTDVHLDMNHDLKNRQITVKRHPDNYGVQCHLTGLKPAVKKLLRWNTTRASLLRANSAFLRQIVQRGLDDTLHCRAHIAMKVNFGTLVLFGYKKSKNEAYTHEIEEFMEIMRDRGIQAELLKHIGPDKVARELISICRTRIDVFFPLHTTAPYEPERPEKVYTATFELKLTDGTKNTDIRLECQFGHQAIEGSSKIYRVSHCSWLSAPMHGSGPYNSQDPDVAYKRKGPLDVKVLELAEDLAWQMEITVYPRLRDPDHYKIFDDFSNSVKLEVRPSNISDEEGEGMPILNFTNLLGLFVHSVVVKSKYKWFISATNYIFEVSKYDYYAVPKHPEGVPATVKGVVPDSRWGASLSSREWVNKLGSQFSLPIGIPGRWDPSISEFFKPSKIGGINDPMVESTEYGMKVPQAREEWLRDGFSELEGRIRDCVELIAKARKGAQKRAEMAKKGVHEDDMD
ncbi:hypothetical protein BDZ91DRAFT_83054 [Kalaharituber pfeilii]|nr:hypothetical protein BDZ91DRAFT_83054 [Kalaharituber pfeilii]